MIKPLHHLAVYLPLVLCSTPSLANCPDPTRPAAPQQAFGPEQTPETLIVETIASARHSLRLAAFGFSSQAVSQALASTPAVLRSARWQPLRDRLFDRVLLPDHPLLNDRWTPLARQLMYLRGHWLRMPPAMLAWHLFRKATMRPPPAQPSGEGRTEA